MNLYSTIGLLLILSVTLIQGRENKYSKALNSPDTEESLLTDDKPFRMMKLNLFWRKAKDVLSASKLKSLKADLELQDKEEMDLKKLRSGKGDENGLKEASVRRHLLNIIRKYHLEDTMKNDKNIYPDNAGDSPGKNEDGIVMFKDKKLEKLWRKAVSFGFSDEQLAILKEEFRHHQEKIDEFHEFSVLTEGKKDEKSNDKKNKENSIEEDIPKREDNKHKDRLRDYHRQLKDGFQELKSKVNGQRRVVVNKSFDDPNVKRLWQFAQEANFDDGELDSLRNELEHYQKRVEKLNFFQEKLKEERLKTKPKNKENHVALEQKVNDLHRHVKKLHKDIETQIKQRHVEL